MLGCLPLILHLLGRLLPCCTVAMSVKPVLLKFRLDKFATVLARDSTCSEIKIDGNGNSWRMCYTPVLADIENNEFNMFGFALMNDEGTFDARYTISLKDAKGAIFQEYECELLYSGTDELREGRHRQVIITCEEILDPANNILKNGALCIDVTVQILHEKKQNITKTRCYSSLITKKNLIFQ